MSIYNHTTKRSTEQIPRSGNYSVRQARNGQFVPQVNGKDVSPTSFDSERALSIARQAYEKGAK